MTADHLQCIDKYSMQRVFVLFSSLKHSTWSRSVWHQSHAGLELKAGPGFFGAAQKSHLPTDVLFYSNAGDTNLTWNLARLWVLTSIDRSVASDQLHAWEQFWIRENCVIMTKFIVWTLIQALHSCTRSAPSFAPIVSSLGSCVNPRSRNFQT